MFAFVLQKIVWFLILPPMSLIVIILTGWFLIEKNRKSGRVLLFAGLALLYLLSLNQVADLLLRPLERAAPPVKNTRILADAVVVPGAGSIDLDWIDARPEPNGESWARLIKGVELARKLRIPLVLTGGNGEPFNTRLKDADVMAEAAFDLGLPRNRVIAENVSRNTLENSRAVRKLVKGNKIILVTSAYYMRRAVAMFSKQGFTVVPVPVYHLAQTRKNNLASLIPRAASLKSSTIALAEWISMAWWGLRGEM
jgi:uncharacterized SAM-binding protein YcdF (DUF218 family)